MVKILKNNTANAVNLDIGLTIPANSQITISELDSPDAATSDQLIQLIADSTITVNDGTFDLTISEGVALIQGNFIKSDLVDNLKQNDRIKVDVVGNLTDGRVKVSSNDGVDGFLEEKVVARDNKVSIQTLNDGSDEDLEIGINSGNINTSELNNDAGFLSTETVTSLQIIGNTLRYINESGAQQDIDLSIYLDDTNLARIVSGTIDPLTKIVTFTRDDSTTIDIDFSSIISDVNIQNEIHVALNGSDTQGNGSLSLPFRTVGAAISFINTQSPSSTNQFCIIIGPGVFNEAPLTCPEWTLIRGCGPRTRINATNVNSNLLTIGKDSSIRSIALSGVTGSSNWLVAFSDTSSGVASASDILLTSASNGVKTESTSGQFNVTITNLLASSVTGSTVEANNNSRLTLSAASINGTLGSSVAINQAGNGKLLTFNVRADNYSVGFRTSGSNGDCVITGLSITNTNTSIDQVAPCPVKILGGNLDAVVANIQDTSVVEGFFFNETPTEQSFRVISELSVGLPGRGKEAALGEGDSYYNGSLVYEFNGSTFTNVSTNSQNPVSGTFSIPGTTVNNAIYVSTAFRDESGSFQTFSGIKIDVQNAASIGSGEIVSEYWDGTNWVEFNTMSEGELGDNYTKYAKNLFQRSAPEQVMFDDSILSDWQLSDPVSLGINLYWVRFRVVSTLISAPIFNSLKIHTNRTEANADGFIQYFGKARRYKTLSSDISFESAANSPSNQDIYLSDNIPVGKRENEFFTSGLLTSSDQAASVFKLPSDTDTSTKAILTVTYTSLDTGTAAFICYWNTSTEGGSVFQSAGAAPTVSPNEQAILATQTYNSPNTLRTLRFELDISNAVPRDSQSLSDLLWIGLRISNSSTVNPIVLVNVNLEYLSNESGAHL